VLGDPLVEDGRLGHELSRCGWDVLRLWRLTMGSVK
jgi:hypothetical protein